MPPRKHTAPCLLWAIMPSAARSTFAGARALAAELVQVLAGALALDAGVALMQEKELRHEQDEPLLGHGYREIAS